MRVASPLKGHFWTVWPQFRDTFARPSPPPSSRAWATSASDARFGSARLTGTLCDVPDADTIVVIVHGLGGSAESPYAIRTASLAARIGLSSLRLNLRGADRGGEDIYHAGLSSDIRAAVDSEAVQKYRAVLVLGFSLGGHIALRFATEATGRARAVAAVCSPLDLAASCEHIDSPGVTWVYRQHVLRGLREMYVAARRGTEMPRVDIGSVQFIRDWDERVVAPRFGFASAEDYWERASVAPRLDDLTVPCLYVGSTRDPMVSQATVAPTLARTYPRLEVRWLDDGGHVGFPPRLGVERDVLRWLVRNSDPG